MVAVKVFISYSHQDEIPKDLLVSHLSAMKRQGLISEWTDRKLIAGEEWENKISSELACSDVILLLISSSFLASNYCYDIEVKFALEQHRLGKAILIPIILKPCDWKDLPFGKIQGLPKDAKPLSTWDNIDEGYLNVVEGIKARIRKISSNL